MSKAGPHTLSELTAASFRGAPRFLTALAPFLLFFSLVNFLLDSDNRMPTVIHSLLSLVLSSVFHLVVVGLSLQAWRERRWRGYFSLLLDLCRPIVIWRAVLLNIRLLLGTVLGCVFLLVPGVIYLMNRVFAVLVLVDESCPVSEACRRSKDLMTAGEAWYSPRSTVMRFSLYSSLPFMLICLSFLISSVGSPFELSALEQFVGEEPLPLRALRLIPSVTSAWQSYLCMVVSNGITAVAELMIVGFYWDLRRRIAFASDWS